jgi:diamine N-acetyltransferase
MLKGGKVTLRAMEREDLKSLHDLHHKNIDLVIMGYGYWEPRSLAHYEKRFEKDLDGDHEIAWFAIEADGKVIGDAGLHGLERKEGVAEMGIGIYDPDYIGKGYGREAIGLLLHWAFRVQNWRRIWLTTAAVNERAIRAYLACGFTEEGRLREHIFHDGEYIDLVEMGMLRSEWEAQRQTR